MAPVRLPKIVFTGIFINNEFIHSASQKTFPTYNPATEEKIADIEEGDVADIAKAVAAARAALQFDGAWRSMDASARGVIIYRLAQLVERDFDYICSLETLDTGKPLTASQWDVTKSMKILRYYAGWCDKIHGKTIPVDGNYFTYTRIEPIGVCGLITSWNYPFLLAAMKLATCLATGNSAVLKPAEQTNLSSLYFAQLCKEAGLPPGVVNVVPGIGKKAGHALADHPDVDKMAFTGTIDHGHEIMRDCGNARIKAVNMELGGKCPMVVFSDCDLDLAVEMAHFGGFLNNGQCRFAASRIFVQEEIYDKFVRKLRDVVSHRVVGDPFDAATQQGPQIDASAFKRIMKYIQQGQQEGATLVLGGQRIGDVGYFIQPTIFADVTDNMSVAREEIFGPVVAILKFKTLSEVIHRANYACKCGLAAAIFCTDINKTTIFIHAVQAGQVWVNCYMAMSPNTTYGGCKETGIGRSLGEDGLKEYYEIKTVSIAIPQKSS